MLLLGSIGAAWSFWHPGTDEPAVHLPAPDPSLDALYNQRPDWRRCGSWGSLRCATIDVPLDWTDPTGPTWPLALTRRPADGPARGALVVNYGGPGVAGAQVLKANGRFGTDALMASYDIVAFDPRGTGESGPLQCLPDDELDRYLDGTLTSGDGAEAVSAASQLFADACLDNDGARARHVGTDQVVQDLDVIRSVLDQPKLTYVGYSYGTLIGALYAQEFGSNVDRMVLDGAVDPSVSPQGRQLAQLVSIEQALSRYVDACLAGAAGRCPLSGDQAEALAQVGALLDRTSANPVRTGSDRVLTDDLALSGIVACLYDQRSWPALSAALSAAMHSDGSALLALADDYNDRSADGYTSNLPEAFIAVTCTDSAQPDRSSAELEADAQAIRLAAPTIGRHVSGAPWTCAHWPVRQGLASIPVATPDAPMILVVGTTGDPATPYEWSRSLAEQLTSGTLLTYEGEGHTAYGKGVACIDSAVDDYLLHGKAVRAGQTCR